MADRYLRFTLSDRLEHWVQIGTFIPLAITGLVQRYSEAALSKWIIDLLGGIEDTRTIHRFFAAVLMIAVVYHLGAIGYRRFVLGKRREMGLNRADLRNALGTVAYLFGRRQDRPEQGRYTFEEKIEYWSLVWGTGLMIVTGFMLWNPIATAQIFPGEFIPASKSVHGFEAVLAILAILVWHIYHVHVRHFNMSMFTGYLSHEEMVTYHPLELAAANTPRPDSAELQRRRRRYLPTYSAAGIVLLAGIFFFITFEDTAIETIEPIEQPVVFVPAPETTTTLALTSTTAPATTTTVGGQTTTTTPDGVLAAASWDDVAAILAPTCGACHGATATGGLDVSTYASAVAGGESGAGIVPGDPDASQIVITMSEAHPATLTDEELNTLTEWIAAGAPERRSGGAATTTTTAAATTTTAAPAREAAGWEAVSGIFAASCGMCHGAANQTAGLDLSSYETALAGGESGPGIVPGDADASLVIATLAEPHPGSLTDAELATVVEWIAAGAPEEAPPGGTTAAGADRVWADFAAIFEADCGVCHGAANQTGGLDLSSYESALAGGQSGPGIAPGDPDTSQIAITMAAGGHPGQLSDTDLADLIAWIETGAPES